jgi:hypothetical protein
MTMSDVARWLDLSWDTIKTVVETRLEKDYRRIGYRHVRHIAIDEIYLGKTHKGVHGIAVSSHHSRSGGRSPASS